MRGILTDWTVPLTGCVVCNAACFGPLTAAFAMFCPALPGQIVVPTPSAWLSRSVLSDLFGKAVVLRFSRGETECGHTYKRAVNSLAEQ